MHAKLNMSPPSFLAGFVSPPSVQFGISIGKHNTAYGDGWRRATEADWTDPAFQAALVQAHQEGGGWALLEEPLECNDMLHVAEGWVGIDRAPIVEVGHSLPSPQQLRGYYPARNCNTHVAWTTTAPALGNNWTVTACKPISSPPCLFVQVPPLLKGVF